tara:strand:- start:151 stop:342 length:192 start_codon:yes stop_codon:yes gene_type:complete
MRTFYLKYALTVYTRWFPDFKEMLDQYKEEEDDEYAMGLHNRLLYRRKVVENILDRRKKEGRL